MRHAHHVAVDVVLVSLGRGSIPIAHLRAAQPVALFASFDQAGFGVSVTTCPTGMCRISAAMLHLQEIAHSVVHIALDVRAHGLAIVRGESSHRIRAEETYAA